MFVKELIAAIKDRVGHDYPVIFRMSCKDNVPGGLDAEDHRKVARMLEGWGVHLLNVTAGWHDAPVPQIVSSVPQGYFIPYAARIKEDVHIPVSCAVRITSPEVARRAIAEGRLDMVTMARALIADPEWPRKAQTGEDEAIRHCICCCHCFDRVFARIQTECSVNATLGQDDIVPALKPKKIAIIGGGPAGSEAARILAERGHRAVVYEREETLGGKLRMASVPPHKDEMFSLARYHSHELKRLGVRVECHHEFSSLREPFDGVIIAGGAKEKTLEIGDKHHLPLFSSSDILSGRMEPKDPVIIVGAGLVGGETAHFLSSKGFRVSLVEIQQKPFADMGPSTRWVLMGNLKKGGVTLYTSSRVAEVRKDEVLLRTPEGEVTVAAGCLISAMGFEPDHDLVERVKNMGLPYCLIGDIRKPRKVKEAVHEAYWAATRWVDGLG